MEANKQPSALQVRPQFEVIVDNSSCKNPEHGSEKQDQDLRSPCVKSTQPDNPVDQSSSSSAEFTHFLCSRGTVWGPFHDCQSNCLPPVLHCDEAKANKMLRDCFAVLLETLCAFVSSLVVAAHQENLDEKGKPFTPRGRKEDGNLTLPSQVFMFNKDLKDFDGCHQSETSEKRRMISHRWRKAMKIKLNDMELKEAGGISRNGWTSLKGKPWNSASLFDRFLPASLSALVYPVSRSAGGEGPRRCPDPQSQLSPDAMSAGDPQWPPHRLHDMPWITFRQELYRLGTFLNLPRDFPLSPLRLAQAGFLQLANNTIVCYFCGLVKNQWNREDCPLQVHRQLRPDCPMVTGVRCDNVPVLEAQATGHLTQAMQRLSLPSGQGEPPRPSRMDHPGNGRQNRDISEDGSFQTPEPGTQGGSTLEAARSSQRSTNQTTSGSNAPASRQTPLRLGLMGGAPASTTTSGRSQILDGTAQPVPPEPEPQPPQSQDNRTVVTYSQLGIITGNPKRPEMAQVESRLATFQGWSDSHRPSTLQLAEAGFFYAGYSDCGRCFYCGGGLKNWEPTDDPWVEHARWFHSCNYVRQCQGQDFIDIISELNAERERRPISMAEVVQELSRRRVVGDYLQELASDPAVSGAVQVGFSQPTAVESARRMTSEGQQLTVVSLIQNLEADGVEAVTPPVMDTVLPSDSAASATGEVATLETENSELRQRRLCKICFDKAASIVFLPCGHLGTCFTCSPALRACPLCRLTIKGRVRVFSVLH